MILSFFMTTLTCPEIFEIENDVFDIKDLPDQANNQMNMFMYGAGMQSPDSLASNETF